jgi:hypothetical protein
MIVFGLENRETVKHTLKNIDIALIYSRHLSPGLLSRKIEQLFLKKSTQKTLH